MRNLLRYTSPCKWRLPMANYEDKYCSKNSIYKLLLSLPIYSPCQFPQKLSPQRRVFDPIHFLYRLHIIPAPKCFLSPRVVLPVPSIPPSTRYDVMDYERIKQIYDPKKIPLCACLRRLCASPPREWSLSYLKSFNISLRNRKVLI